MKPIMTVMLANNTGVRVGYLAGRFPGRIGHLYSPAAERGPFEFLPYALDNGAYGAFTQGRDWESAPWTKLLRWAKHSGIQPRWVLVPDVVGDRDGTLAKWDQFAPIAAKYGWPLAFAVQDGMTSEDVPVEADVVFVGGSTRWKWHTMARWCQDFPRVHVGRVNTYRRLIQCDDAGAESVDGTGWMRGSQRQYNGLVAYLEEALGVRRRVFQESLRWEVTA